MNLPIHVFVFFMLILWFFFNDYLWFYARYDPCKGDKINRSNLQNNLYNYPEVNKTAGWYKWDTVWFHLVLTSQERFSNLEKAFELVLKDAVCKATGKLGVK